MLIHRKCTVLLPLLLLSTALFARTAVGQEVAASLQVTLHPMAAPRQALQYRLLPPLIDLRPGNAAVDYGKVTAEETRFFGNRVLMDEIVGLQEAPLETLRAEAMERKLLYGGALDDLESGARREFADWQLPIGEGRTYYTILLPEVQQMRQLARLIAARARLHIARGEFEEAIHDLQTGYAIGQHITEGETLVNGLVGVAISSTMSRQVQDFVQQPGAPNLYWALSSLPSPLIDLRRAVESERFSVQTSFPELKHVEDENWAALYWQQFLQRSLPELADLAEPRVEYPHLTLTFRALKYYPEAREFLLSRGYSAERIDAMPASQLAVLSATITYAELSENFFKWYGLPYWQAEPGLRNAERKLAEFKRTEHDILPIAATLLPGLGNGRAPVAKADREIAVLRVLEAIRMHGASNHGQLPTKLMDLEVPTPVDPVTGKPFDYRVTNGVAILEGPPLSNIPLKIEIRFAEKASP